MPPIIRSLEPLIADRSILFVKGDIGDAALMRRLFEEHKFTRVAHLAAELHVDRSISRSRGIPANQRARNLHAAQGRARRRGAPAGTLDRAAFCMSRPMRSMAASKRGDDPPFSETSAYAAQFALFRIQSKQRPSGARLPSHVRAADDDDQLLEQLQPYSDSRKS